MAATKPRNATKRKSSVRVTKKQGLVVAAVLALVGVVVVVATRAAVAPNKVFVVTSDRQATAVATDGSSQKAFAVVDANVYSPAMIVSRAKTKYMQTHQDSTRINVRNITDGKLLSGISPVTLFGGANWLPGDKQAVFMYGSYPAKSIFKSNVDGTSRVKIASASSSLSCLNVQKNSGGSKIAYLVDGEQIWTMNPDGSGKFRVENVDVSATSCPIWSPDGKKLTYAERTSGSRTVINQIVINANGTGRQVVAKIYDSTAAQNDSDMNNNFNSQVWSNGGSSILFTKKVNGVQNLYYVNISTKKVTQVTKHTQPSTLVTYYNWGTDNRIVYAYGSHPSDSKAVRSQNADGSNAKTLFTPPTGTRITSVSF